MKKTKIAALLLFLLIGAAGCGQAVSGDLPEGQESPGQEADAPETEDGNGDRGRDDGENGTASAEDEGISPDGIEGLIEEQSFVTTLDGWGEVMFASIAPGNDTGGPDFALVKEGEIVYRFPGFGSGGTGDFVEVGAVAFRDYNRDGKEDIAVLVRCSDGTSSWNSPRIFLRENSDDMFYLDHPDLESYRLAGDEAAGAGFYRDTFLEEYLAAQRLTENMSAMLETWPDYVEYADSFCGYGSSPERQMELFARYRDIWAADVDFADESYCFTMRDLDYDGKTELIVANYGGTGHYTYIHFYKIDEGEQIKELETSFTEGASQPDIIIDKMTVYSSFSPQGMRDYYIVYDQIKDSPDSYIYRTSSLCVNDDYVLETPLATQTVVYEGEDYTPRVSSEDCRGNLLSEEEYENFPEKYYSDMGLTKKEISLLWTDVSRISQMSIEEAEAFLKETYL